MRIITDNAALAGQSLAAGEFALLACINKVADVAFLIKLSEFSSELLEQISRDVDKRGSVVFTGVITGNGEENIIHDLFKLQQDETTQNAFLRSLFSIQRLLGEIQGLAEWISFKKTLTAIAAPQLALDLRDYADSHDVREIADLSPELIQRVKDVCPDEILDAGVKRLISWLFIFA